MPKKELKVKICGHCGNPYRLNKDGKPIKKRESNLLPVYTSICEDYIFGMSYREIAKKYDCTHRQIGNILDMFEVPRRKQNYKNRAKIKELIQEVYKGETKYIEEIQQLITPKEDNHES